MKILIADDSPLFRKGLHALLRSFADAELVGEATTGEEAVALSARLQPDVILMDLKMPDVNGIEATRRIVQTSPHIGILVLTMFQDDDSVFAAMRAGMPGVTRMPVGCQVRSMWQRAMKLKGHWQRSGNSY